MQTIAQKQRNAMLQEEVAQKIEEELQGLVARMDSAAAAKTTLGQKWAAEVGQLLDQAEKMLTTVHRELDTAAAQKSTAEQRSDWLNDLKKADDKSWLTLRLAGTSRKEQKKLTSQYVAERAQAWQEASRASGTARETLKEAWNLVHDSRFAEPLGANKPVPGDVETVSETLQAMRGVASRHGHSIVVCNQQRVAHLQKEAATQRAAAGTFRSDAADASAEKQQRQTIAERFPKMHERETAGRVEHLQERKAAAAEQARNYAATATRYEPQAPDRSRGGPSMGR